MLAYGSKRGRARRAVRSTIAEAAGRRSLADKRRVYAIVLAECCEAAAAVEIAGALRACSDEDVRAVTILASRVARLLSGHIH
jgi:four helix bundle protein